MGMGENECWDHDNNWEGGCFSLDFNIPWRTFFFGDGSSLGNQKCLWEYSECPVERTHWLPAMRILTAGMLLGNQNQGVLRAVEMLTGRGHTGTQTNLISVC